MSLTGSLLSWVLWIAAIALFNWSIFAWPRASGPGWLAVLRRIGYQLGVVALVVLAIGVSLNDEYGWYSNWTDLASSFGGSQPAGDTVAAGAQPSDAAAASGNDPRLTGGHAAATLAQIAARSGPLDLLRNPGPDGQYHDYQVDGPISGVHGSITVWFPADYSEPAEASHRYAVLEAFHGIPGSPRQFAVNFDIGSVVTHEVSTGQLAPTIVVAPNFAPRDIDTECVNGGRDKLQMEDWITRDVTNWVDQHLRVQSDRGSWATMGFSAGAWCASMLAMLHPNVYSAAISLGGYFQPTFEPGYVPFKAHSVAWQHYDLVALARNHPPKVALWVQSSKVDQISYRTTAELLAAVRPPLSITADVLLDAGHRISVWVGLIPQTLQWLGTTGPGFRPVVRPAT